MTPPRILLATLAINEMEWLPKLYEQHRSWDNLVSWVFVESADWAYKKANPEMVSKEGLSVDGTTEFLQGLAKTDPRVSYCGYGLSRHERRDQGKVEARNCYLKVAEVVKPDFIVVLDADEFYTYDAQRRLGDWLTRPAAEDMWGFIFRQREMWRPSSCLHLPLFSQEVVGGLWKMHHCHYWRWSSGIRYVNSHVWPETAGGQLMNQRMMRYDTPATPDAPEWFHLGWAASQRTRNAKTRYYYARGEGVGDGRQRWMTCRAAWDGWKPGDRLPYGARVIPYTGQVPECFQTT